MVLGEANRRLRWALAVSIVSSAVVVLQELGRPFWLTPGSGYALNSVLFVAIALGFWVWWASADGEARTFDRELELLLLGTGPACGCGNCGTHLRITSRLDGVEG